VSTKTRIEEDVRAALERDPRIERPELIAVSADEIGTVVLRGAVTTFAQRLAAVHDARRVDGVRIRSTHIDIEVSRGELTLTGYVREESERAAAVEDVGDLTGVLEVTNRIKIR
jgi:osmotically-inducible protein OsmY